MSHAHKRLFRRACLILSLTLAIFATRPVDAQQPSRCADRGSLVTSLRKLHGSLVFVGLMGKRVALEVWVVPKPTQDGTDNSLWMSLVTGDDGQSCVVASGKGASFALPEADDEPAAQP